MQGRTPMTRSDWERQRRTEENSPDPFLGPLRGEEKEEYPG